MRIELAIETRDKRLGFEIAGVGNKLTSGTTVEIPGGSTITFRGIRGQKSFGAPEILQFIVDTAKEVEIGLLGAWLYDKVKGKRVERIIVNRTVITEITESGIRQVLTEEISSSD